MAGPGPALLAPCLCVSYCTSLESPRLGSRLAVVAEKAMSWLLMGLNSQCLEHVRRVDPHALSSQGTGSRSCVAGCVSVRLSRRVLCSRLGRYGSLCRSAYVYCAFSVLVRSFGLPVGLWWGVVRADCTRIVRGVDCVERRNGEQKMQIS